MEKQTQLLKRIRQRKFLMVLPLLVLPFLTFLFWSLGGGKVKKVRAEDASPGLNLQLPEVTIKHEKDWTKMDYYNQAQSDSVKFRELRKNDPHYEAMAFGSTDLDEAGDFFDVDRTDPQGINSSIVASTRIEDSNQERIYQKLAQLDKALSEIDEPGQHEYPQAGLNVQKSNFAIHSEDIDRLEQMMQTMSQSDGEDDGIRQLNGMLEKILDIQHPDRVQEKLKQNFQERKEHLFEVESADDILSISSLVSDDTKKESTNGFYSLDEPRPVIEAQHTLQAVVHETQTLMNGSVVKLRLVNDVYIDGVLIPKNQFLFGMASLNGERLLVKIKNIQYQKSLFPVDLSVYDVDGMNGIYVPGAIGRDVAKESASRSMQSLGLTSLDPTFEAQATSAGIDAAKNLFSRKVKLVKVTVKAGYQVLLKDEKYD